MIICQKYVSNNDSTTELRTTQVSTTELRTTQLQTTQLQMTELTTTQLRTTQLRNNFEKLNFEKAWFLSYTVYSISLKFNDFKCKFLLKLRTVLTIYKIRLGQN
jgi:hypothetical protein